jgi:hypothetical protein
MECVGWIRVDDAIDARPRKRGSSQRAEIVGDKQEGEWHLHRIGPILPVPSQNLMDHRYQEAENVR